MVIINAVYIIASSGISIYAKTLQKNSLDPDLISSFLSAVDTFASEVIGGDVRSFKIEKITFCFKDFRDFFVVIGMNQEFRKIDILLEKIGIAFMIEHGADLKPWRGSTKPFQKFESTLGSLLEEVGFKKEMWDVLFPTQALDALQLAELPTNVREVATALLTIREGTLEEILAETGHNTNPIIPETLAYIRHSLDYLVENGLSGYNQSGKRYFIYEKQEDHRF